MYLVKHIGNLIDSFTNGDHLLSDNRRFLNNNEHFFILLRASTNEIFKFNKAVIGSNVNKGCNIELKWWLWYKILLRRAENCCVRLLMVGIYLVAECMASSR